MRLVLEVGTALVDRFLADPPAVHAMAAGPDPEIGLWGTDRECYALIAETVRPGMHTLETGSGLSTVIFAATGADHTCVTPSADEAARILAYCERQDVSTDALRFELGASDEVLPRLAGGPPLDVVFVDGNHGYPTPMIDWFYAASRLVPGGLLILDDIPLPAVAHLCAFIERDPRFSVHRRTAKWIAYRTVAGGSLRQDWFEQPFYTSPTSASLRAIPGRAARRVSRELHARFGDRSASSSK
ncbi:MAG TPA: class I SAM-dependent methyltransferase [Acidimicrobiia bacterium]|nr:class I SAM-dependent methyltransferase [Acidimicrobiia bacterium]